MYTTNIILYIAKKRELRETAPEVCCLTLRRDSYLRRGRSLTFFSQVLSCFEGLSFN